jgi:hypothetical protein
VDVTVLGGSKSGDRTEECWVDLHEYGPIIRRVVLMIAIEAGSGDLREELPGDEGVIETIGATSVGRDVGGRGMEEIHDIDQVVGSAGVGHHYWVRAEDIIEVANYADVSLVGAVDTNLGGKICHGLQAGAWIAVATLSEDVPLLRKNRMNTGPVDRCFAAVVETIHN